ncbi:MAG TPA: DUF2059 domain-containing protein [Rhodocyclaceae bacterium]|nr:DUF2059 domain-containing protein [Rhodocyclaceae bacterium]
MKAFRCLLAFLLLCSTAAIAAPASEGSIRELLTVSRAGKLMDSLWGQFDTVTGNAIKMALGDKKPSPEEQQAIDRMVRRTTSLLKEEMSWQKLEPMYVRLYQDSFTEEEVQAMVAFYRTPAGQALIEKMPTLMQRAMLEVQTLMAAMMPKLQIVLQDFAAEMKACRPEAKAPAEQQAPPAAKSDL